MKKKSDEERGRYQNLTSFPLKVWDYQKGDKIKELLPTQETVYVNVSLIMMTLLCEDPKSNWE